MPYFRKASVLAEIGWDFQQMRPKNSIFPEIKNYSLTSKKKSDIKIVPLFLSHPTKSNESSSTSSLSENIDNDKFLEIYSPNRQNIITLKFEDSVQCTTWFNAIYTVISV